MLEQLADIILAPFFGLNEEEVEKAVSDDFNSSNVDESCEEDTQEQPYLHHCTSCTLRRSLPLFKNHKVRHHQS